MEEKILFVSFTKTTILTEEFAKFIVSEIKSRLEKKDHKICFIINNISKVEKPARDFLADQCKDLKLALVMKSPMDKILGNFFYTFSRPTYTVKVFHSSMEAESWLKNK